MHFQCSLVVYMNVHSQFNFTVYPSFCDEKNIVLRSLSSWHSCCHHAVLCKESTQMLLTTHLFINNLKQVCIPWQRCHVYSLMVKLVHDKTVDCVTDWMREQSLKWLYNTYKEGHSCKTALMKILNDLLWAMENQKNSVLVLLDLSSAFYTVDHDI